MMSFTCCISGAYDETSTATELLDGSHISRLSRLLYNELLWPKGEIFLFKPPRELVPRCQGRARTTTSPADNTGQVAKLQRAPG